MGKYLLIVFLLLIPVNACVDTVSAAKAPVRMTTEQQLDRNILLLQKIDNNISDIRTLFEDHLEHHEESK